MDVPLLELGENVLAERLSFRMLPSLRDQFGKFSQSDTHFLFTRFSVEHLVPFLDACGILPRDGLKEAKIVQFFGNSLSIETTNDSIMLLRFYLRQDGLESCYT